MESLAEDDTSLPLSFDVGGMAAVESVLDVASGPHLEYPDGSIPMVTKVASGRMSPVRARTMKEYDQQLAELKKENFNLKLRIYFLEEKMQQTLDDEGEDLFKTNIELKVQVESLKKELNDKHELLRKASTALESISAQHQTELDQAKDATSDETAVHLVTAQNNILALEQQLRERDAALSSTTQQLQSCQSRLQELVATNFDLNHKAEDLQATLDNLHTSQDAMMQAEAVAERDRLITELRSQISELEQASDQHEENQHVLSQATHASQASPRDQQCLQSGLTGTDGPVAAWEDGGSPALLKLQQEMERLRQQLSSKDVMIGKLEDVIRDRDQKQKVVEGAREHARQSVQEHEENAVKRDKAIQGLTMALQQKIAEVQSLMVQLEARESELIQVKDSLHDANLQKYAILERHQQELAEKEDLMSNLENLVHDKQLESEQLKKTVSRRDADVAHMSQQLEKAEDSLRHKEGTVQGVWAPGVALSTHPSDRTPTPDRRHQMLQDDAQRQLDNQEKLMQRMTRSLQEKDQQLQDYLAGSNGTEQADSRDSLINSLHSQVSDKEQTIEAVVAEKYKSLEQKDAEIRQLKMSLRERDRDIARANQMLLNTEETVDSMENEGREKDQAMSQLASALKQQQRALEEAALTHAKAIEEKENLIQKLRASLAQMERNLQETIRQSPSASDSPVQQLQQRLQDQENLMEEVMSARTKAVEAHEDTVAELMSKLRARDKDIQNLRQLHQRDSTQLSRHNQALEADLKKRDYQLQTLEEQSAWTEEQQQEIIDKMRNALHEKDNTIEALLESGREKDKLLQSLQNMDTPPQASAQKLAELQTTKDRLAQLENELLKKEDHIERLRSAVDRRSPKQARVARQQLEEQLQEKTENELRREVYEGTPEDKLELARLRGEVEKLRELLQQPNSLKQRESSEEEEPSAQLQQVIKAELQETQNLKQALDTERQIYVSLNRDNSPSGENWSAFEIELATIQSLRAQLEDGIEHNKRLRSALEKQIADHEDILRQDKPTPNASSVTRTGLQLQEIISQTQAEASSYQPSAAQSAAAQSHATHSPATQPPASPISAGRGVPPPHRHVSSSKENGNPATPLSLPSGAATTSRNMSYLNDSLLEMTSFLPSFRELPDVDTLVPDEGELAAMTPDQLRAVIRKTKVELIRASDELQKAQSEMSSQALSRSLNSQKGSSQWPPSSPVTSRPASPGLGSPSPSLRGLQRQIDSLQHELRDAAKQKADLLRQIDILKTTKADQDPKLVVSLRKQVHDLMEKLAEKGEGDVTGKKGHRKRDGSITEIHNELLKLRKQLEHEENLNSLLKRQLQLNMAEDGSSERFNPELIVQMAQEIEQLKEELEQARIKLYGAEYAKTIGAKYESVMGGNWKGSGARPPEVLPKPPKSMIPMYIGKGIMSGPASAGSYPGSNIPRLSSAAKSDDHKGCIRELESKLASTEATVRSQADKMKYYRSLLEDAGLIDPSPRRSRSESNLAEMDGKSDSRPGSASWESIQRSPSGSSGDLSPSSSQWSINMGQFTDYGNTNKVDILKEQIAAMKIQLQRANQTIGSLRHRQRSQLSSDQERSRKNSREGLPPSGKPGEPTPLMSKVMELRRKLDDAETENKQLHDILNSSQKAQEKRRDREALVKQVVESQDTCQSLRSLVGKLRSSLNQCMPKDAEGNLEQVEFTPDKIRALRVSVQETEMLAQHLSAGLEAIIQCVEPVCRDAPAAGLQEEVIVAEVMVAEEAVTKVALHTPRPGQQGSGDLPTGEARELSYILSEAKAKNQELQEDKTSLIHQVSALQEKLLRLEAENGLLSQRAHSLEKQWRDKQEPGDQNSDGESRDFQAKHIHQLEQTNDQLAHQVASLQQEKVRLISNSGGHQEKLVQLQERLHQEERHRSNLQRRTDGDRQQLAALRDQAQEHHEKYVLADREKERILEGLQERDELNTKLKQLLQEHQEVAEKLRSEVHRLNTEQEEKEATIAKLKRRLKALSKHASQDHTGFSSEEEFISSDYQHGLQSIYSGPLDSIERGRHSTSPERFSAGHMESPLYPTFSSNSNRSPGLISDRSQDATDFAAYGAPRSHLEAHAALLGNADEAPSLLRMSHLSSGTYPSASSHQELLRQNNTLKLQLHDLQDVNDSLRGELGIYENLRQTVQSGIKGSSQAALLERHLEEIRELRLKLEQSLSQNDRLRAQLEKQLYGQGGAGLSGEDNLLQLEIDMLKTQLAQRDREMVEVDKLARDLVGLQQQLSEKTREIRDRDRRLREQDSRLSENEATNQRLTQEKEAFNSELRAVNRENQRLREDLKGALEQLQENQELNKTLHLELSFYDKMHENGPTVSDNSAPRVESAGLLIGLDLNLLLEEIRQLRIQLVRTIDNNNLLRQKLEDQLSRSPASQSPLRREDQRAGSTGQGAAIYSSSPPTKLSSNGHHRPQDIAVINGLGSETARRQLFSTPQHHQRPTTDNGAPFSSDNLRYSINDTQRPPDGSLSAHINGTTALTPNRIGTDLRCLYAIGALDDYELLKKEVIESVCLLSKIEERMKERLQVVNRQGGELDTLKSLSSTASNLHFCLQEQLRIVKLFWFSQLPQRDQHGNFVDAKLLQENETLQKDLLVLKNKYSSAKQQLKTTQTRLEANNKKKEGMEEVIIRELNKTHAVLKTARTNLERSHSELAPSS